MQEYKGYGGSKITVDGDTIRMKQLFINEAFTYGEITALEFIEPNGIENGKINLSTKKHTKPPLSIVFLKKDRDSFAELHDLIAENTGLPSITGQGQLKQAERDQARSEREHIKELKKSGVLYCPKCMSENVTVQIVQDGGVHKKIGMLHESVQIKLFAHKAGSTEFINHKEAICQKCGNSWTIQEKR
jgi:predicted nucleic-acid-binding Zn-ribbon protein